MPLVPETAHSTREGKTVSTKELLQLQESPASILEAEVAPALDRILEEYGHRLRPHLLDELRRVLTIVEELFSELDSAYDEE